MTLYCRVFGQARLTDLVLVHGWGMSSDVWTPWLPVLEQHFRVHAVDLPGMGRSSDLSLSSVADLANAVLEVAPERAVWCGWSLGGVVAAKAAELAPARVAALATLATNPCFVQRADWPSAMPEETFRQFQAALGKDWRKTLQRFIGLQVQGDPEAKPLLRMLRGWLPSADQQVSVEALSSSLALLAEDYRALFAGLSLPQWHLLGGEDSLVPASVYGPLAALVNNAKLEVLPDSAHLPFLSDPETVAAGLLELYRRSGVAAV